MGTGKIELLTTYADTLKLHPSMRINGLTLEQVIAEIRRRQGNRHAKDVAVELGISPQYLADLYRGRREPGETVLSALGLQKRVLYERVAA